MIFKLIIKKRVKQNLQMDEMDEILMLASSCDDSNNIVIMIYNCFFYFTSVTFFCIKSNNAINFFETR